MSKANHHKFVSLIDKVTRLAPINKTFDQIVEHNKALMMFKGMHDIAPTYLCNRVYPANKRHERKTRFPQRNNIVVPFSKNSLAVRS